jgi:hypothetical protein
MKRLTAALVWALLLSWLTLVASATVTTTTARNDYTGNGATTVYPYTFRILANSHIQVMVNNVVKSLTTDYTVSGVGSPTGGNITFLVAPPTGQAIVFSRRVPFTQTTDYVQGGPLPAETLEQNLDKLTMMVQQLQEQQLALAVPPTNTVYYSASAASAAIANTTTETTFSTGTVTVAAGDLNQLGAVLCVSAGGTYSTTGTPTLTLRIKTPTSTTTQLAATTVTSASNEPWSITACWTVTAIGASGALGRAGGLATVSSTTGNTAAGTGAAVDLTVSQNFTVTAQWGTANAANTITARGVAAWLDRQQSSPALLASFSGSGTASGFAYWTGPNVLASQVSGIDLAINGHATLNAVMSRGTNGAPDTTIGPMASFFRIVNQSASACDGGSGFSPDCASGLQVVVNGTTANQVQPVAAFFGGQNDATTGDTVSPPGGQADFAAVYAHAQLKVAPSTGSKQSIAGFFAARRDVSTNSLIHALELATENYTSVDCNVEDVNYQGADCAGIYLFSTGGTTHKNGIGIVMGASDPTANISRFQYGYTCMGAGRGPTVACFADATTATSSLLLKGTYQNAINLLSATLTGPAILLKNDTSMGWGGGANPVILTASDGTGVLTLSWNGGAGGTATLKLVGTGSNPNKHIRSGIGGSGYFEVMNSANSAALLQIANGGNVYIPAMATGSAGGKKVVCYDTATKELIYSSTSTDCTN